MTRTEEIANEVFERHLLSAEAENLGLLAKQHESNAAHSEEGSAARIWGTAQAKRYRQAQNDARNRLSLKKCRTIGCATKVAGAEFCPRCEEELNGEPYPLSDVLMEFTLCWRLGWGLAIICAVAIIIAFARR